VRLEPVDLQNDFVRLEPMAEAHRADLRAACDADPATFVELLRHAMHGEHFEAAWRRSYAAPTPDRIPFAVCVDGRCMGVSGYLRIDPANASVEIGGTFYHPTVRGGPTNPAAKRLLLEEAFARGARRVHFQVDAANARSRAAMLKLGAVPEGVLRRDTVVWTGRVRDSVIFSILDDEWPGVRDRLDARLAAFAG
jgi:RimJ/RimL family protein N-acetyltransferase